MDSVFCNVLTSFNLKNLFFRKFCYNFALENTNIKNILNIFFNNDLQQETNAAFD